MLKLLIATFPNAIHAKNNSGTRPKDMAGKTAAARALLEAAETPEGLARIKAEALMREPADRAGLNAYSETLHAKNNDGKRPKDKAKTAEARALFNAAKRPEGLARIKAEAKAKAGSSGGGGTSADGGGSGTDKEDAPAQCVLG